MSAQVKSVKIVYHRDEGAWWADSPDMPGFSAVGDTFDDTRKLALEDIPFYFDGNRPDIVDERMENGASLMPGSVMFFPRPADSRIEVKRNGDGIESIVNANRTRSLQVA